MKSQVKTGQVLYALGSAGIAAGLVGEHQHVGELQSWFGSRALISADRENTSKEQTEGE